MLMGYCDLMSIEKRIECFLVLQIIEFLEYIYFGGIDGMFFGIYYWNVCVVNQIKVIVNYLEMFFY